MARFQVSEEYRLTHNNLDGRFLILHDQDDNTRAEIWPALGFNCVRWSTSVGARTVEWLYSSPQLLAENQPTRSGIPILFPFPNRIRAGRFSWEGKSYQLLLNDPAQKNASHGFACRHPWRVVDQGTDEESAWVTGEFWASTDAPDVLALWPADHKIQVTYRLGPASLHVQAVVENPGSTSLPFGLGYHPYFALPASPEKTLVEVPANKYWQLQDSLPTGSILGVDGRTDLRTPRPFAALQLDDVLTGLTKLGPSGNTDCGTVRDGDGGLTLSVSASPAFRELVVFVPPHRQAVCLEPYTCVTDAINLQQQGIDAGWLVLPPGQRWSATVEFAISNRKYTSSGRD